MVIYSFQAYGNVSNSGIDIGSVSGNVSKICDPDSGGYFINVGGRVR